MKKRTIVAVLTAAALASSSSAAFAASSGNSSKTDKDGNGYPDAGVVVSGHEDSSWTDSSGVTCKLRIELTGGRSENNPYQDSGWIQNHYQCDDGSAFNYLFVHETDPRYTGNPELAIWGNWEWHILTVSGSGNIANPNAPQYGFGS